MHLIARRRLLDLIATAKDAVVALDTKGEDESMATFYAGLASSRAAGFLEAFTIANPEDADEMLQEFGSLADLIERCRSRHLEAALPGKL